MLVDVLDFLVRMLNPDGGRWDDELDNEDWLAEWLGPSDEPSSLNPAALPGDALPGAAQAPRS